MKKHQTFEEMFNDNDFISPEEREQINFEVDLIGKMIEAKKDKAHFENIVER